LRRSSQEYACLKIEFTRQRVGKVQWWQSPTYNKTTRADRVEQGLGACLNLTLLVTFNLVAHQSSANSFGNVILICF
jgi:hypothetical protein